MGTIIRPEVSKRSRYYIDRHRYYELKHFCLQYPVWKKSVSNLHALSHSSDLVTIQSDTSQKTTDPTAELAEKDLYYLDRIEMVEKTAEKAAEDLSRYLLMGVTQEISYEILKAKFNIPCCKEKYYEMYRKFFYILSSKRQ